MRLFLFVIRLFVNYLQLERNQSTALHGCFSKAESGYSKLGHPKNTEIAFKSYLAVGDSYTIGQSVTPLQSYLTPTRTRSEED
ncbi:MAG: hypothetical protein JWN56_2043 [Sphingobacteriales bacterium]|nr:hypothetical protein [Sphingobacteriales bacterium]